MWPKLQPVSEVDRALARELAVAVQAVPAAAPVNAMAALIKSPPGTLYVEGFCVRNEEAPSVIVHAWLDTSQTWEYCMDDDADFRIVDPTPGYCEADAPDVVYFPVNGWEKGSVADKLRRNDERGVFTEFPFLDHDDARLRDGINWHWARIEAQMHLAALYEERTGRSYFSPDFDFRLLMPRKSSPGNGR